MSNTLLISVVIGTYNRAKLLKKTLQKLEDQSLPKSEYEVIVVDDGSKDNTKEKMKEYQGEFSMNLVYQYQENARLATARNTGIKKSQGEIIALTDDDCEPSEKWLETIKKAFEDNPNILGVEGITVTSNPKHLYTHYVENMTGGSYQTSNMAYKKSAIEKAGMFDQGFYLCHREDSDIAFRIQKLGNILFVPESYVYHPPRPTKFLYEVKKLKTKIPMDLYFYHKDPQQYETAYGEKPWNAYIGFSVYQTYIIVALIIYSLVTLNPLLVFSTTYLLYYINLKGKLPKSPIDSLKILIDETLKQLVSPWAFIYYKSIFKTKIMKLVAANKKRSS